MKFYFTEQYLSWVVFTTCQYFTFSKQSENGSKDTYQFFPLNAQESPSSCSVFVSDAYVSAGECYWC